ncbi:MAG: hypothetical protein R3C53_03795 [Pirellulaceae bacterium]
MVSTGRLRRSTLSVIYCIAALKTHTHNDYTPLRWSKLIATPFDTDEPTLTNHNHSLRWLAIWGLAVVFVSGGATCAKRKTIRDEFLPPFVFQESPTLEQIVERVNHSLAIQQLESNNLTITSPDMTGKLSGSMIWERPDRFKLQAYLGTKALGTAFAAGSNSNMFWLHQRMPSPPTIYWAAHQPFDAQTGPRQILPVSPLWLREALGVVEFDPHAKHEGPHVRPDQKLEVVSYIPSHRGTYRRVLVMDAQTLAIEQTQLYDQNSKMVGNAHQSEHQYYSALDWSLPHRVSIELHPDYGPPLAFTIEVGFYIVNPAVKDASAFAPPDNTGIVTVDLVEFNARGQATATPPNYTSAADSSSENSLFNFRH